VTGSDKAYLYLNEKVKAQDNTYWSTGNPYFIHGVELHEVKAYVWWSLSATGEY
jgi:hypothetical protein